MGHRIPIETFRGAASLLTDAGRRIRYCSPACTHLLGREPHEVIGRPCWKVVGLRDARGAPFCSPRCPVQQQARLGTLRLRHQVVFSGFSEPPLELELLTFAAELVDSGHLLVLHLLMPPFHVERALPDNPLLDRLTNREREILELLAAGSSTTGIASELRISRATVRNHIQHTLTKLRVHGRLEATLVLLRSRSSSS